MDEWQPHSAEARRALVEKALAVANAAAAAAAHRASGRQENGKGTIIQGTSDVQALHLRLAGTLPRCR